MAVVQPIPAPAVVRPVKKTRRAEPIEAVALPKFRRCTFRRLDATKVSRSLVMYDAQCLYPEREMPLGNLAAANAICASCTNPGIFRPDAD